MKKKKLKDFMNNLSTDVLVKPVPFCFLKMTSWRQWVKQTNRYDRSNPCVYKYYKKIG